TCLLIFFAIRSGEIRPGTKTVHSLAYSVLTARRRLFSGQVWWSNSRTHHVDPDQRGKTPCRIVPEHPQKIYGSRNVPAGQGIWSHLFHLQGSGTRNHTPG